MHIVSRLVKMEVKQPIPRNLNFGGIGVKIRHMGQPARCDVWVNGHVTAECPLKGLCRSCKQEGHIARNYPSGTWGRLQDNAAERSVDPTPAEAQHLASGPAGSSSTAAVPNPVVTVESAFSAPVPVSESDVDSGFCR